MKTIIYLDQNYVSYLTKARLRVKVYPDVAAYYENLYDALRDAVRENAVVCPVSQFHYAESELDTRLAPEIYRSLEELYCGVELLPFQEIILAQVTSTVHDYLGIHSPPQPKWKKAFTRNPDEECHYPAVPKLRTGTSAWAPLGRRIKQSHGGQPEPAPVGDLQEQKRFEARAYVTFLYWEGPIRVALGMTGILTWAALQFPAEVNRKFSELLRRQPTEKEIDAFLASEQMVAAPFIDVYSSLRAAMVIDRDRKTRGSDLNDVLIAASVLPYCDVFATDGHVKQLLLALKLDKRYKITVFGSRRADVLDLTSLVSDL